MSFIFNQNIAKKPQKISTRNNFPKYRLQVALIGQNVLLDAIMAGSFDFKPIFPGAFFFLIQ